MGINLSALEKYINWVGLSRIEDVADALIEATTDLSLRVLADDMGEGLMDKDDAQIAIYNIYHIAKALRELACDNTKTA